MDRAEHRNFTGRKLGVMKKANMLHHKHKARVTVLIERNDTVFCYQSDPTWPVLDTIPVEPRNMFTPDNFDTVAERSVPASVGGSTSRSSSPYSLHSFGTGCEPQAVHEAPQKFIHGSTETVCVQDQTGAYNTRSPDALVERELSPGFLPVLDMELQASVAQQVRADQQQVPDGVSSLLSLWSSSSTSSGSSLDSPGLLDSSSAPLPLVSEKPRYPAPDTHRSNVKSQPGQSRTPIRKSNRTNQQAKKYF